MGINVRVSSSGALELPRVPQVPPALVCAIAHVVHPSTIPHACSSAVSCPVHHSSPHDSAPHVAHHMLQPELATSEERSVTERSKRTSNRTPSSPRTTFSYFMSLLLGSSTRPRACDQPSSTLRHRSDRAGSCRSAGIAGCAAGDDVCRPLVRPATSGSNLALSDPANLVHPAHSAAGSNGLSICTPLQLTRRRILLDSQHCGPEFGAWVPRSCGLGPGRRPSHQDARAPNVLYAVWRWPKRIAQCC